MAGTSPVLKWGSIFLLTSIGYLTLKLYQQRVFFWRTVKSTTSWPTLPDHSWLLGNLIAVGKIMAKYPKDAHGQLMPDFLARDYPEVVELGLCYIDLWPISWPMLATFHPDIFCPVWKKWRATFNPGFSTQDITALVPEFIEKVLIWKRYLQEIAKNGRIVPLEDCVMKATCDIIGRSVLGISLGPETGVDDKIFPTLKSAISLLATGWSPHQWGRLLNPFRHSRLSSLNRQLRSQLQPLVEAQLQNHERNEGPKTVNGLAIRTYLKEHGSGSTSSGTIDIEFLDVTIENLKIFLFVGHDTTASTL
ncbi:hypothetical protein FVEG_17667 [Fusarium verticillioides 7600]|uniref:Cytochrome P450 n=1 Tax=Gibberella moniliformis (strain M3125 / FGSC 7600) TaxID=334819 RepID=A0A139YBJ8_GIBM7|nr:hypothetical protein FVEG_17667 [Fusarium verticillioides 7600]KYG13666.1 hypothetical protein FVEG_17667 [Fusarium verticillioides 7600]